MSKETDVNNIELIDSLERIDSEQRNPDTRDIDQLDSAGILRKINQEDQKVAGVIAQVIDDIAQAVDRIVEAFANGGRLIYIGAGTSGRLGVLDAVECPPTFSVPSTQVVGIIAGGEKAICHAVEGAEDNAKQAVVDLKNVALDSRDVLVGIAASGRTPYVISALQYAASVGADTVAIACTRGAEIFSHADISICASVGPEALTGSTRMKSGSAQKMILNMLTTASMIRSGKVYQNLMVDVNATNKKLEARAVRIVMQATGCDIVAAEQALNQAQSSAKLAILMLLADVDADTGRQMLARNKGFLRACMTDSQRDPEQ